MLAATALAKYILELRPGYLTGISTEQIQTLHTHLMEGTFTKGELSNDHTANQINSIMDRLQKELDS